MKKIKVLISKTRGISGKIIRALTFSKYSHASISIDGINFYSFNFKGFSEEHPYHIKRKIETVLIDIDITDEEYSILEMEINRFKENKLKYKYSIWGLVFSFLHIPVRFKNKYFCSQFVVQIMQTSGIISSKVKASRFLPHNIINLIKNSLTRYQLSYNAF